MIKANIGMKPIICLVDSSIERPIQGSLSETGTNSLLIKNFLFHRAKPHSTQHKDESNDSQTSYIVFTELE